MVEFANGVVHRVAPVSGWYPANSSNAALVRTQLPLRLAWALTVHKSQGMTLERLQVELAGAFEFGQSYVALSRATSLEGLWLNGPPLRPDSVKAHPAVKQFYDAHKRRQSAVAEVPHERAQLIHVTPTVVIVSAAVHMCRGRRGYYRARGLRTATRAFGMRGAASRCR